MPTHIIDQVHQFTDADNQNPALDFLDQNGDPIEDDEFDDPTDEKSEIAGVENAFPIKPVGVNTTPGVNPPGNAVYIP